MYTTEAATLADALDGLGAGLFVVDAAGRIVHANASGQAMVQERAVLRAADGRLAACDGRSASALRVAMAKAAGPEARSTTLPLSTDDGMHSVAHLMALAPGNRRSGASYPALAAVLVHKAAIEANCRPEVIAELYNLTRGEMRVLLAIVEVGGVAETAESLGLSEATVKTHLHRVFGKTGTGRQADLVKLVAGFSNPLVGGSRAQAPARPGRPPMEAPEAGLRLAS
jgi:DNA-binding CsgD family transcriptional regulator